MSYVLLLLPNACTSLVALNEISIYICYMWKVIVRWYLLWFEQIWSYINKLIAYSQHLALKQYFCVHFVEIQLKFEESNFKGLFFFSLLDSKVAFNSIKKMKIWYIMVPRVSLYAYEDAVLTSSSFFGFKKPRNAARSADLAGACSHWNWNHVDHILCLT